MTADITRRRQADIEAACRVAMRMLNSGRGAPAALQFLVDVTARQFAAPAALILKVSPSTSCNHVLVAPPSVRDEVDLAGDYWSIAIQTREGKEIGEMRLILSGRGRPCDASSMALKMVARTAADIMTHADVVSIGGQSCQPPQL